MMLLLVPLILVAVGLAVIVLAFNDKVDARRDDGSARLPSRRERPLYHLHMQIRAAGRPESPEPTPGAPAVVKLPRRQHP